MNEACRYWHAAYNSAAIAVEMGTVAQLGATASILTITQAIIADRKFKLEAPTKLTRKLD